MKNFLKKLIIVGVFLIAFSAHQAFAAFAYKSPYTVQSGQVPSTQTDFPMLISVTDARLKTTGNGGHVQSSTGLDIYAYSDSGLTTRIPLERERYNATTGEYIGWVKVASLADASVVYLAYGDSGISTDPNTDGTYGATSVWNSAYKMVQHFPDGTTLSMLDSTSNDEDGTGNNTPFALSAVIDGGVTLGTTGNARYITTTYKAGHKGLTAFTLEAWAYVSANLTSQIVGDWDVSSGYGGYGLFYTDSHTFNVDHISTGVAENDAISATISNNTWYHVIGTYDGTTLTAYVNGSASGATDTASGATNSDNNTGIAMGLFLGNRYEGSVDEVRISNVNRGANYVTTTYNNQNAPGTFAVLGTESAVSSSLIKTFTGLVNASMKAFIGLVNASLKTRNGLTNQ